jgi:hypothetical protein
MYEIDAAVCEQFSALDQPVNDGRTSDQNVETLATVDAFYESGTEACYDVELVSRGAFKFRTDLFQDRCGRLAVRTLISAAFARGPTTASSKSAITVNFPTIPSTFA